MSNSKGNYVTTTKLMMKAFDKLPKSVRIALANSDFNYVPQPSLTKIKRGASAESRIASFRASDLAQRSSIKMKKVWGAGHPQAISGTVQDIYTQSKRQLT